jgi:anaerobic selenocysteine-containing dehydrogenase
MSNHPTTVQIIGIFESKLLPYRLLMIHGVNPMSQSRSWREQLAKTPYIVSFSSFMDETETADLILPDHTYLERWDIHESNGPDGRKIVSLMQPVLKPQLDTRQTADVLLAVAREMGGPVGEALPFESAREIIEKGAIDLVMRAGVENTESVWSDLTEKGLVSGSPSTVSKSKVADQSPISLDRLLDGLTVNPTATGTDKDYPLTLIVYENAAFGDGSVANLPSIQELPDPLTSVIWGSWLEINPRTATELGIVDGDYVEVTTANGALQAMALLFPAIRPDCIAMPVGQGQSRYGRYSRNRGVDPNTLLNSPEENIVRSRITRVGGNAAHVRFGTELMEHMEMKR